MEILYCVKLMHTVHTVKNILYLC